MSEPTVSMHRELLTDQNIGEVERGKEGKAEMRKHEGVKGKYDKEKRLC
jgi:hypothetical protein